MKLTVDRQAFAAVLAQAAKYVAGPHRHSDPVDRAAAGRRRRGRDRGDRSRSPVQGHDRGARRDRRHDRGQCRPAHRLRPRRCRDGGRDGAGRIAAGGALGTCPRPHSDAGRGRLPRAVRIAAATSASTSTAPSWPLASTPSATRSRRKRRATTCTGISWSIQDGRLELAATNGHILSTISIETPAGAEGLQPMIVPDFAMPAFTGPVRVDVADDRFIRFSGDAGAPRVGHVEADRRHVSRLQADRPPGYGHRDGGAQGAGRCGRALHAALPAARPQAHRPDPRHRGRARRARQRRRRRRDRGPDRHRGRAVRACRSAAACSPRRSPASTATRSRSASPGSATMSASASPATSTGWPSSCRFAAPLSHRIGPAGLQTGGRAGSSTHALVGFERNFVTV